MSAAAERAIAELGIDAGCAPKPGIIGTGAAGGIAPASISGVSTLVTDSSDRVGAAATVSVVQGGQS